MTPLEIRIRKREHSMDERPKLTETPDENGSTHSEAIGELTSRIQRDPESSTAYFLRGNAFSNAGDHPRAVDDLTRAIELDASGSMALNNRGVGLHLHGSVRSRHKRSEPGPGTRS